MEVLRRRGGVGHLDVVLGALGEEALDAGRGVLGALALVAVGQQHHQARGLIPLVLGGHDVLVDDRLGAVHEVAELRLPRHEGILVGDAVAVLEAQRGVLRQQGVVDPELGLLAGQRGDRDPGLARDVVDQAGVALAEGAPPAVLPGQADRVALHDQARERQQLGGGPLHLALLVVQLRTSLELAGQLRVGREALRVVGEVLEDPVELGTRYAGVDVGQHAQGCRRPGRLHEGRRRRAGLVERLLEAVLEVVEGRFGLVEGDVAPLHQRLGEQLADAAMALDGLVHERLGVARVVALVVAVAPVADEVDHDVLVEPLAVVVGQPRDAHAGLRVVAVHVQDRRLDHLGHVGGVLRRAGVLGRGGEPELVVDHDVDGAAHPVAGDVAHVQALGHHALAGEGGVAVEQDRQHREAVGPVDLVLACPDHAEHHRIDGLEVRGVGGQLHLDVGARPADVLPDRAEVVLHVARALHRRRIDVALELPEDLVVALADDVGQHVQPTAVRHAEHRAVEPVLGCGTEHGVEDGDRALGALEAEALRAHVLGGEELLEGFGGVETAEQEADVVVRELDLDALDVLLDPALLLGVLDVHVLDADRAAVGIPQHVEQVAQLHGLPARPRLRSRTPGRGPRW